jgi:tRNA/tmRNA/rRNA uracil-C5-methylase (TrmA/RlmC/RlmD family)
MTRAVAGALLEVPIDGVDDEGRGRATQGELDLAVRGAFPGDIVRCAVERVFAARGLAQARALSFTTKGALHLGRTCPHPAPCPGCPLEGIDAGFASELKRARVIGALRDMGLGQSPSGDAAASPVDELVPSRGPRQKVKLTVGGRAGALRLGMFVPHSHVLVSADECPHVHPAINDALAVLGEALDDTGLPPATLDARGIKAVVARAFRAPAGSAQLAPWACVRRPREPGQLVDGGLRAGGLAPWACVGRPREPGQLVDGEGGERSRRAADACCDQPLRAGEDVVVGAVVVTGAPLAGDAWRTLGACVDGAPLIALAVRVDAATGNSLVGGDVVRFVGPQLLPPLEGGPDASVDAFCQTDADLAVDMSTRAAGFLTDGAPLYASFVDAYAGAGGFARALLAHAPDARVTAIERAPAGLRALRSLPVDVVACAVEDALPALQGRAFDGIVVDPPKSGLRESAAPLAALRARRAVLVACDPDAGARDARAFVDAGYRIVAVAPYDLFPATPEVETVFLLELSEH